MPMPADAIVQRNCGLIEAVLAQIRGKRADVQALLGVLAAVPFGVAGNGKKK